MGIDRLGIKLFLDGASLDDMRRAVATSPWIRGFTTNPSLMRQAGVEDYAAFARKAVDLVGARPISFEVFSDTFEEMEREARAIREWGDTIYVKIPVTDTRGTSTAPLIRRLSRDGIPVNVTAILTLSQVETVAEALAVETPAVVSVFAGRIADTGVDPAPVMSAAVAVLAARPKAELLWASSRELLNIFQAAGAGCHIITLAQGLLAKLNLIGKDLEAYSIETVKTFHADAMAAGYSIPSAEATGSIRPRPKKSP